LTKTYKRRGGSKPRGFVREKPLRGVGGKKLLLKYSVRQTHFWVPFGGRSREKIVRVLKKKKRPKEREKAFSFEKRIRNKTKCSDPGNQGNIKTDGNIQRGERSVL